jgi:hypothetical protein
MARTVGEISENGARLPADLGHCRFQLLTVAPIDEHRCAGFG